jgi:type IV pilus assembly protein PilC
VLERIAGLMEKENALRRKVSSAMVYPIFVFVFALLVTFGLVLYIFPKFMEVVQGINVELPLPTKVLIFITNELMSPFFVTMAIITIVTLSVVISQYLKTPLGKKQKDRLLLDLPLIGRINSKVVMSRFCRTLGTLLQSGVPLLHSMEIVSRAAGNEVVSAVIEDIKSGLKAGMRLSQPLREHKIFPPIVAHMVAVGEETGNLASLLDKLANYYDMEVEHALGAFGSMVEPIMILLIGSMVGFVLLSVFMPIYRIIERINA